MHEAAQLRVKQITCSCMLYLFNDTVKKLKQIPEIGKLEKYDVHSTTAIIVSLPNYQRPLCAFRQ